VVENLACDYIETIGSRVGIPPIFFVGHWTHPKDRLRLVDQVSLMQNRHSYFRLSYQELHHVNVGNNGEEHPFGLCLDAQNTVLRVMQLLDRPREFEYTKQQVSLWSIASDTGS
jgi:hypothetical protein